MLKVPATILCICLILYVFRFDRRLSEGLSAGLWIPTIWLMIISSRPVSQWLQRGGTGGIEDIESGSPIDRAVFTLLIFAAVWCLARRKVAWGDIIGSNRWLLVLLLFAGLSIAWSDYPLVSFKRWVRGVGVSLAVLIVATEASHFRAIQAVLRRVAFLWVPLSVLFIKYYRQLGVAFGHWGGTMLVGVTNNKNILGRLSLLSTLYFAFVLLEERRNFSKAQLAVITGYLGMSVWLLDKSDSSTSLATVVLGCAVMFGLRALKPSKALVHVAVLVGIPLTVVLFFALEALPVLVSMLGRDVTLTGRTDLWGDLLLIRDSALMGSGYGAFWVGGKLEFLWSQSKYWWRPTTAHNGYLEIYLQLGVVGLLLLVVWMTSVYGKLVRSLQDNPEKARFCLALFFVFVFYNVTESATSFHAMMWFVFSLYGLAVEPPRPALQLGWSAQRAAHVRG
jgi:exopolysaccharide production protein ExoQ